MSAGENARRATDAEANAAVRATTRAAKDRRILGQWAMGERCVTTIARAVGCTRDYAAKVLRSAGKEVPEAKRKGAKLGAIIRRTKGERR